jgi:pyruvate formate lyase activating enzyme
VKDLGYAIKLDSNGSRPDMIGRCMEQGLIDYLALDHKLPAARLHELGGSAGATAESRRLAQAVPHEFRSTLTPDLHDTRCLAAMAEELPVCSPWVLQLFRPGDVLDPDRCSRAPAIDYLDAAVRIGQKRGLAVRLR